MKGLEQKSVLLGISPSYADAYNNAQNWGVGGDYSRALNAVTTALVGGVAGQGASYGGSQWRAGESAEWWPTKCIEIEISADGDNWQGRWWMNMPADVAKWLLFYLHILKTDDLSPQFFLGGNLTDYPPGTSFKQQLTVDMIYRCLKCNLIDIDPEEWRQAYGLDSIEAFARELARVDPNSPSRPGDTGHDQHLDRMLIWLGPQLYGADTGNVLVDRYFPGQLDLEDASRIASFNKEVCEIFEANAVSWTGDVLIPLK